MFLHHRTLAAIVLAGALFLPSLNAEEKLNRADVFISGQDGYHTYRIPSLLSTREKTLLAFCEARKNDRHDNGDIDLVVKRSADGGKTWSKQQVIWNDGTNTCGNPTPVQDQKTGTIWLFMSHNPGSADNKFLKKPGSEITRTVWLAHSDDDGKSWSEPVNLTKDLKGTGWGWYATGPGVGIQIQQGKYKGRLVIPACHNFSSGKKNQSASHVIFSGNSVERLWAPSQKRR
ncbi:MAG: exo-alpha-sialidase [Limisphaerales bacterium]